MVGIYGEIKAFINNGDKTEPVWAAQESWDVTTAAGYVSPSLAKMDGDDDLDLAYTHGSYMYGFENIGGTSAPSWQATNAWDSGYLGAPNLALHVVDMDGDTDLDAMVGIRWRHISAFENTATEYTSSGTYESGVVDTGVHRGYTTFNYDAEVPTDTTVDVEFRAGDSTDTSHGSWTGWQSRPVDGDVSALLGNERYFQYRLTLTNVAAPSTVTPKVFSVTINTANYPESTNIAISNDAVTLDQSFSLALSGSYSTRYYVAVEAYKDYVYAVYDPGNTGDRYYIIDASDPANLTYVGDSGYPGGRVYGAHVHGDYLYVAVGGAHAVDIMDLANPAAPSLVKRMPTGALGFDVAIEGEYGYIAGWRHAGLQVFNNVTSASAALVSAVNDTAGDARSVSVAGNRAYIADYPLGVLVFDVTDKANPVQLGSYGSEVNYVKARGNYAFVTSTAFGFRILDTSDPTKIKAVGTVPEIAATAQGIHLDGSYAYVTSSGNLYVIDVRDPSNPFVVTSLAVSGSNDLDVSGTYAYVARGGNFGLQAVALGSYNIGSTGTLVSKIIDVGPNTGLTTLDFTSDVPVNTSLTVSIRTGSTPTPEDGGWTDWAVVANSGDSIAAQGTNRYVQYRLELSSTDATVSPKVSDVTVNFQRHAFETSMVSSAFDSTFADNLLDAFSWTETLPANTDIRFQVRAASDDGFGAPDVWTDWMGPDGSSATYWNSANTHSGGCLGVGSADCSAMADQLRDGLNDQWFQYKVVLTSAGDASPVLADVTLPYFQSVSSGINVSVSNGTTNESTLSPFNFSISLPSQPSSDVTLNLYSTNTMEGVLSTSTVTFTNADWSSRQVTVTPLNDDIDDGNVAYSIVIAAATSEDASYHNINPADIAMTNNDDDVSAVEVNPTSVLETYEDGSVSATFDVRLTSQPLQSVTIPVASDNTDEGALSIASLIFDDTNWNVWQTVTVTGVVDGFIDGNVGYNIVLDTVTTSDPTYTNYNPDDVSITSVDIDIADIVVTPGGTLTTSENFRSAAFTIALASRPTVNVTIMLQSSDMYEGVVLPSSMFFTPDNWDIPQTASVNGKDDAEIDGDVAYKIETTLIAFGEPNYATVNPDDINVINEDNDGYMISVIVPDHGVITNEGSAGDFSVKLGTQPTHPVTINLTSSDKTEGLVPASITFLPTDDITQSKRVHVTALDDEHLDGDAEYTITLSSAVSDDPNFGGLAPDKTVINVTNKDNNFTKTIIDSDKRRLSTRWIAGPVQFASRMETGHFNDDTYLDLVVSEWVSNTGSSGAVYVYPGSADGYSKSNRVALIRNGGQNFGAQLAVGDFNKDGFDDILVGQTRYSLGSYTNEGQILVYFGGSSGISTTMGWNFIGETQRAIGVSVAAEDLNGDGADEIIASATGYDSNGYSNNGRIYIFNGVDSVMDPGAIPSSTPTKTIDGTSNNHGFGYVLAAGGDVNDDGYNDLLVGAHYRNGNTVHTGTVYAYSGSPAGVADIPSWSVSMANLDNTFGRYLASAGDVNGDGIDDILVGAGAYRWAHTQERAMVFYGGAVADGGPSTTPDWDMPTPYSEGSGFGTVLTSIGDIDNDGYDDIFVGASSYRLAWATYGGRGHIYNGSASGPSLIPDWVETAGQTGGIGSTHFATSAVALGDINTDGIGDFAVGAPSFDLGQQDEGAALIYTSVSQIIPRTATVTENSGFVTYETINNISFDIVLDHPPADDVNIPVSSSDTSEGTVSVSSITFNASNWDIPQTVTVTGVDDNVNDSDVVYYLEFGLASSADAKYAGIDIDDIELTNINDDRTANISTLDGIAIESGSDTASFEVSLDETSSVPITVNYSVGGSAVSGVDYTALSGAVTIPAWQLSATIELIPLNDSVEEINKDVIITLTSGTQYDIGGSSSASAVIGDDDSAGIVVSPTSGLVTTETGGTAQFSVVLTSQPTDVVEIAVSSLDKTEGMPNKATLTFTVLNWATPQIVTVVGVDDSVEDPDTSYIIAIGSISSTDGNYSILDPDDVTLTNQDDDEASNANVRVVAVNATQAEDDVAPNSFRITRTGNTAPDLVVNFSISGNATLGIDYFASSRSSVTIPAGSESVDVTITSRNDHLLESQESIALSLNPGAGYVVDRPNAATIMLIDDDTLNEPYANFLLDQVVEEGEGFTVTVILSNAALEYPVSIPYTISGDALTGSDHNAADGTITINSGTVGSAVFTTVGDGPNESDEMVTFTMGTPTNAVRGGRNIHSVTITEENVPPTVNLSSEQSSANTRLIVVGSGAVTLTATVADANSSDTHTFDWGLTNNSLVDDGLDGDPATFVFDPSGLSPGFYNAHVMVTDSGSIPESGEVEILLEVVNSAPVLTADDSDSDGVPDNVESFGDSDGDGIADYKDNDSLEAHELQAYDEASGAYVLRTDVGLSLRLGVVAFAAQADGADVTLDEIASFGGGEGNAGMDPDDGVANTGGYFDYEIWGLTQVGQSARLVLPQFDPIPSGAVYRKYFAETGWSLFVEDDHNSIASAEGAPGVCPAPGDNA